MHREATAEEFSPAPGLKYFPRCIRGPVHDTPPAAAVEVHNRP